jgi:hypothetical protein
MSVQQKSPALPSRHATPAAARPVASRAPIRRAFSATYRCVKPPSPRSDTSRCCVCDDTRPKLDILVAADTTPTQNPDSLMSKNQGKIHSNVASNFRLIVSLVILIMTDKIY